MTRLHCYRVVSKDFIGVAREESVNHQIKLPSSLSLQNVCTILLFSHENKTTLHFPVAGENPFGGLRTWCISQLVWGGPLVIRFGKESTSSSQLHF